MYFRKPMQLCLSLGLYFTSGMSHAAPDQAENVDNYAQQALSKAYEIIDKNIEVVSFDVGDADVSDLAKTSVKALIDANKSQLERVVLASWSDKKLDAAKLESTDEELAKKRVENMSQYMRDSLKVESIESYNMAVRPNWFEKTFNMDEAKLKQAIMKGTVPLENQDKEIVAMARAVSEYGGPGKLVVVVRVKGSRLSH